MFGLLKKIPNPFKRGDEDNEQNDQNQQQNKNVQKQDQVVRKKEDDINYQIIDFQIDPMENIPRVFNYQNGKPDEEVVDYIPPKRNSIQKIQEKEEVKKNDESIQEISDNQSDKSDHISNKYNCREYKVTPNDTLYQICDKFQVNLGLVLKINDMSDDHIFAGMVLKIPESLDKDKIQDQEDQEDEEEESKMSNSKNSDSINHTIQQKKNKVSQQLIKEQNITRQYHVSYCTGYGRILGKLQIQDDLIIFNPDLNDLDNRKKMKNKSIKFQVSLDIKDVNEAIQLTLPPSSENPNDELDENNKDFVVQICLSSVNKDILKKYKEKLKKLKEQKKSISCVTFKIYEYNKHGTLYTTEQKQQIAENIVKSVENVVQVHQFSQQGKVQNEFEQSLTVVPFYDILYDNIIEKQEHKVERKSFWEQIGVEPKMDFNSQILKKQQFLEIVEKCVPSVFMMSNWNLVYSNWEHGTSLNTLYRNCEESSPVIIIIQQFNGHYFGGYVTDPIQSGFKFTGSGESSVFMSLKYEKQQELKKKLMEELENKRKNQKQEKEQQQNQNQSNIINEEEQIKTNENEISTQIDSNQNEEEEKLKKDENEDNDNNLQEKQQNQDQKQEKDDEEEDSEKEDEEITKIKKQVEELELPYGENVQVFPASGNNTNYQYSDAQGIGIGCGEKYAFFIKSNLYQGTSYQSETYNSPQLSTKMDFEIQNIEVWGLDY